MLSFALFTIALNVITVAGIFVWVWFIAGKNKVSFGEKLGILDKKIDGIDGEMSMSINTSNHFNESLLTDLKIIQVHINDLKLHIQEAKKESEEAKEVSKKVSDQHEEYHDGMLEKLNHAGELIVNYESFYESTLSELDEISRFLDILSKRPTLSSDPDFSNFTRAIQLMTQIVSKYSSVAAELKKEIKVIKPD